MTPTAKQALREHILQTMSEGCIHSWIEVQTCRRRIHQLPWEGGLSRRGRLDYYDAIKSRISEHRVNIMMTRAVREAWQDEPGGRRGEAVAQVSDTEGASVR